MDGIQLLFALVIELCRLITGNNIVADTLRPLSPAMRQEVVKLDKTLAVMLKKYEQEQKELTEEVAESQKTLQNTEQQAVDLRLVLRTLREMTDIKELTPTLVNSLIERIEVHNSDKSSGHSHVKVDIYFTAVGMIDIPTEKEIRAMIEEIQKNPQDFKFVA